MTEHLRGMLAAVHSPFHADGSLNLDRVERQAEHLVRHGVSGSFVCGSTGEGQSLTVPERMQLAERWTAVAGKSLRVIIHVGHNCQLDARELATHAQRVGVYGIAAVAPSYFRPATVQDLVEFIRPIAAAAASTPFYYYHIPKFTGVDFPVADLLPRAAGPIPNLAGAKYTHNDFVDFGNCLMLDDGRWDLVFGSELMLLSAFVLGARAAIGTTFNYTAPFFGEVFSAWDRGDLPGARHALHRARQFITRIHGTSVLPNSKAVMKFLGIDCGPVRPPLCPLSERELQQLRVALEEYGVA